MHDHRVAPDHDARRPLPDVDLRRVDLAAAVGRGHTAHPDLAGLQGAAQLAAAQALLPQVVDEPDGHLRAPG